MEKISGDTRHYKKRLPKLIFGFIAFWSIAAILMGAMRESVVMIIVPIIMTGFTYILFKMLVWDLVDEVYDHGEYLEFRNDNKNQKVYINDIIKVDYNYKSAPERVIVHSKTHGELGTELPFCLPLRSNPFSKSKMVKKLIERIDNAKNT